MKSLIDILKESILDDIDTQIERGDEDIKAEITAFLNENYKGEFKISNKPNKDGLYEVSSAKNVEVKENNNMTSLTNGMFIWHHVKGEFVCYNCQSLESLEGAPEKIDLNFYCSHCNKLTSLKGAPKEIGGSFYCYNCQSLESLEGAPEKIGETFDCSSCPNLISLKGAPKKINRGFYCGGCTKLTSLKYAPEKVGKDFYCDVCKSLESLEYAPKEVGRDFVCGKCKIKFTKDDVKQFSNVKGRIVC